MSRRRKIQAVSFALFACLLVATAVASAAGKGRTIRLVTGDHVVIADLGWYCSVNQTAFGKALVCQTAATGSPTGKPAADPTVVLRGSEAVVVVEHTRPTIQRTPVTTYTFHKYFP